MTGVSQPNLALNLLVEHAHGLGLALGPDELEDFACFVSLLLETVEQFNLTSIRDLDQIQIRLLLDSLTVLPYIRRERQLGARLVDVGSGAGMPGLALAFAWPLLDVTLIEATKKKADFIARVVATVPNSRNSRVVTGRAEDLARMPSHREQYDLAVARAVGSVAALIELLVPLLRVDGLALLMKSGSAIPDELDAAAGALSALGATVHEVIPIGIQGLLEDRILIVIRKIDSTSDAYPRRSGIPQRRPIGARSSSLAAETA